MNKAERVKVRHALMRKLHTKTWAAAKRKLESMNIVSTPGVSTYQVYAKFLGMAVLPEHSDNKTHVHYQRQKTGAPHPEYKRDEGFYRTREWRELRYLALRNTDGRCGACGASAADGVRIHVDHIQPRYKRPDLSLSLDNLQVLCEDCNAGKGAWDATDWRYHMRGS